MDNLLEKLKQLIKDHSCLDVVGGCNEDCERCLADYLIASGVTVHGVPDNDAACKLKATELPRDFGRWIPVEERKPDTVFCEDTGKRYSEAVNVLTSGRKVITAIYDGEDFIGDAEFWEAWDEVITHWTPVLLPLPEPQKGE